MSHNRNPAHRVTFRYPRDVSDPFSKSKNFYALSAAAEALELQSRIRELEELVGVPAQWYGNSLAWTPDVERVEDSEYQPIQFSSIDKLKQLEKEMLDSQERHREKMEEVFSNHVHALYFIQTHSAL